MSSYARELDKLRNRMKESGYPSNEEDNLQSDIEAIKNLERENRRRIYSLSIASIGSLVVIGFFISYKYHSRESNETFKLNAIEIFSIGFTLIALLSAAMAIYLQQNRNSNSRKFIYQDTESEFNLNRILLDIEYANRKIRTEFGGKLDELGQLIREQGQREPIITLDEAQKGNIYETITNSIAGNLTSDFYDNLKDSIKKQIIEGKKEQLFSIEKRGENSINRLRSEIELLSRRANINLVIGSTVTLCALLLLGYFVIKEDFNSIDTLKVVLHFIPRLSLVFFIEFFSFFFLKLYRASLHEIKYYQNELTNLESKAISILFAANYGSETDISNIIKEMSLTERNFRLQKGESTVELERSKAEKHDLKEILAAALGAYKKDK